VGRLGVDDSEAEVGEDGDSCFSMCGERDGDMSGCGASPPCDEGCDVVLVGEIQSGSFGCGGLVFVVKSNGYGSNGLGCMVLNVCVIVWLLSLVDMLALKNVALRSSSDFDVVPDTL